MTHTQAELEFSEAFESLCSELSLNLRGAVMSSFAWSPSLPRTALEYWSASLPITGGCTGSEAGWRRPKRDLQCSLC